MWKFPGQAWATAASGATTVTVLGPYPTVPQGSSPQLFDFWQTHTVTSPWRCETVPSPPKLAVSPFWPHKPQATADQYSVLLPFPECCINGIIGIIKYVAFWDFLHLIRCVRELFTLLLVSVAHSFLLWVILHCMHVPLFVYPDTHWWAFGLF